MPIGGSNIGWDNTTPSDVESAGLGDDRIRSLKSSVQEGLDNEHNWATGGGANTGYHRLGSARPYVGTQSLVSSSGSDGRLMQTSDSSRLFAVGSGGTSLIGGATVISAGSFPGTVPQRHYWAMEFGNDQTASNGSVTVSIPNSGYSGLPWVLVGGQGTGSGIGGRIFQVAEQTASAFRVGSFTTGGAGVGGTTFNWFSIGSRVL